MIHNKATKAVFLRNKKIDFYIFMNLVTLYSWISGKNIIPTSTGSNFKYIK